MVTLFWQCFRFGTLEVLRVRAFGDTGGGKLTAPEQFDIGGNPTIGDFPQNGL